MERRERRKVLEDKMSGNISKFKMKILNYTHKTQWITNEINTDFHT